MRIDAALTPDTFFPGDARGKTVIVIDVLRASTSIVTALENGAEAVVPVAEPEEARKRRAALGPERTLLCGERGGRRIGGFDLGNSPAEYHEAAVRGKTLFFTSTNGSRAMVKAKEARELLVAGFVNAGAVVSRISGTEGGVLLVCSGREGRFSLEDAVCAGMIAFRTGKKRGLMPETGDEAEAAVTLFRRCEADIPGMIARTLHGRYLASIGMGADLPLCARTDAYGTVPVRVQNRLVRGENAFHETGLL